MKVIDNPSNVEIEINITNFLIKKNLNSNFLEYSFENQINT